jgi:hypothetical protein
MDECALPAQWVRAIRRDAEEKPSMPDPAPERRVARLLAAFIASGLMFMVAPGTLLGVWNLVGISSRRQLTGVSAAWIQAHGHAQFFGWVGTFIIGISLYTLPKFRGAMLRSVSLGWAMWGMWSAAVMLRWLAGVGTAVHASWFRWSAGLELAVGMLLMWQCSAVGPKYRRGQAWEGPVVAGFAGLIAILAWQFVLTMGTLRAPMLPAAEDRVLISLALWAFAFPVVLGYCAKFFPGLLGAPAANATALRTAVACLVPAAAAYTFHFTAVAAAVTLCAVAAGCWGLRVFHQPAGPPKTAGVDARYPQFARLAYGWVVVAAGLGFFLGLPGMLGASRHAFTVGFLATLIFSIGPRILPSFLSSRELWSARAMLWALALLTAGCALRVAAEPLAYGEIWQAAWKLLPSSAFAELAAVGLFGINLGMSMTRPVPSWFGRRHVNERMSVYWLTASYPRTRRILVEHGLKTLERVREAPRSLTLREAAEADGVPVERIVGAMGDFFESRLARSLRRKL